MKALIYQIELLAPALLGRVEGEPNSSVSYPYVPGGVVRGALINRFAGQARVDVREVLDDPKTKATAQRLFFGGARFLNAYPADRLGNRALPAPRSWRRSKSALRSAPEGKEHTIPIHDVALTETEPDEDQDQERIAAPFCWVDLESHTVRLVSPHRRVMVHTQRATRNRNFGRPRDDDGAVYRYESLDAGQTFIGVILCDDADEEAFKPLLDGEYWLGKAHTSGYGRARFQFKRAAAPWREVPGEITAADGRLIVTLTSPLLLRDGRAQFSVDAHALGRYIAQALGVNAELERAFVAAEVVGGFNRKWGLPLPQAPAFSPGSVLALRLDGPVSADGLRALEEQGLGERRIEGFGRLVFNWQGVEELKVEGPQESTDALPLPIEDGSSRELAERIARRRFEQKLEALWLSHAARLKVESNLSRAQLNRLRSIALNTLRDDQGAERLEKFIASARKRQTTRERWSRAKIEIHTNEKKPLLDWIENLSKNLGAECAEWCKVIGVEEKALPRVQVGKNIEVSLAPEQQREFSLRLLAEVLKRAAKDSK